MMSIPPRAWVALGCVIGAAGMIWALQGTGALPGSVMSGDPKWLVIGAVTAAVGVLIAYLGVRAGRT